MRDIRDPEKVGEQLANLKKIYPNMSAAKRADMVDESFKISQYSNLANINGKATVSGTPAG